MDASTLYEQLVWALRSDINDGSSAEAQKDMGKIHDILRKALQDEYDNGFEEGRCEFQTG